MSSRRPCLWRRSHRRTTTSKLLVICSGENRSLGGSHIGGRREIIMVPVTLDVSIDALRGVSWLDGDGEFGLQVQRNSYQLSEVAMPIDQPPSVREAIDQILEAAKRLNAEAGGTIDGGVIVRLDPVWAQDLKVVAPAAIDAIVTRYLEAARVHDWTSIEPTHGTILQGLRDAGDDVLAGAPDDAAKLLYSLPVPGLIGPDFGSKGPDEVASICALITAVHACSDAVGTWWDHFRSLDIRWDVDAWSAPRDDALAPIIDAAAEMLHQRNTKTVPSVEWLRRAVGGEEGGCTREIIGWICLLWLVERGMTDDVRGRVLERLRQRVAEARARSAHLVGAGGFRFHQFGSGWPN